MEALLAGSLVKLLTPAVLIILSIILLFLWLRITRKELAVCQSDLKHFVDQRAKLRELYLLKEEFETAMKAQQKTNKLEMSNEVLKLQGLLMAELQSLKTEIQRLNGSKK